MSRKSKGINAERDLIHKFWGNKWAAIRIAGSGSNRYPSADIIASNRLRKLVIECKASGDKSRYLTKEEVKQFKLFSELFGAEPWIAIKFDREDWFFLHLEDLEDTGANLLISKDIAKNKGLRFEEIIKI